MRPAADAWLSLLRAGPGRHYIGKSPVDGYFQLDDLKQVEVLRGPQGPCMAPAPSAARCGSSQLARAGHILRRDRGQRRPSDHSDGTPYSLKGMINVRSATTLAFRASAKYAYEPGFVNTYGLFARTSNDLSGIPLLAKPGRPSRTAPPSIQVGRTGTSRRPSRGRASLLWKPSDAFSAGARDPAFERQRRRRSPGNPDFPGGASPLDPASTLPAGGRTGSSRRSISPGRATPT